jgi:hypothetical protein
VLVRLVATAVINGEGVKGVAVSIGDDGREVGVDEPGGSAGVPEPAGVGTVGETPGEGVAEAPTVGVPDTSAVGVGLAVGVGRITSSTGLEKLTVCVMPRHRTSS